MTDPSHSPHNILGHILAVLVLYRRNLADAETFISLSRDLVKSGGFLDLFVYDNSPSPMVCGSNAGENWHIHYHHDPTNPGVSRAYNAGCRLARQMGKKWLLLLDQDTLFPLNALMEYGKAVANHPTVSVIAPVLEADNRICSPCRYLFRTGFHPNSISSGIKMLKGRAILNSGMLISVGLFERCGGFDERVKLDFADFAFNNRLRRCCQAFYLLPVQCRHGFSGASESSLDDELVRFSLFTEGAACMVESNADAFFYRLVVLKRALRLTIQYRSLRFFMSCFGEKG